MRRRRRRPFGNPDLFISTWKTDNLGTSGDTQITLPLEAGGDYDFGINWGDGSSSKITAYDQTEVTHTYPIAGTYKVQIDGVINGWKFGNGGDKAKITDISQWGDLLIGNSGNYFQGCSSLNVTATDVLDVSGVTNFARAFDSCTSLTTLDVSNWDVSSVTTFDRMFVDCRTLATVDVSNWDVSNATEFKYLFAGCHRLVTLDVSAWELNTDDGISFRGIFYNCTKLTTLDVSNWDTSNVATFWAAFYNCNKLTTLDISSFAITLLTDAAYMLEFVTIANYSDVLINWAAQIPNIKNNVTFNAGTNTYNAAGADAKALLEAVPYNWSITDGGLE